jgi:hypothetical protein
MTGSGKASDKVRHRRKRRLVLDQLYDGEWVSPVQRGYVLECCKCSLRHVVDFRLVKGQIQFRARRVRA